MSLRLTIREATAMDAEAIAAVHVETWRSAYAGLVPDAYLLGLSQPQRAIAWRETIGRGRGVTHLVALGPGGELLGFGDCGATRSPELPYAGEVYALYIHPDWQNKGVGRRLLTTLFEELAAAGRLSAFLWVLSANPSRFFYQAMGGQVVGQRQERFAGAWLDETAFAWTDLVGWLRAVKG